MSEPTFPKVHKGGTTKGTLEYHIVNAYNAIGGAITSLLLAEPKTYDYDEDFDTAIEEHERRMLVLNQIYTDLGKIHDKIKEQDDYVL